MTFATAALAVVSGALLYAGHPPLGWEWASFLALTPLLLALRLVSVREVLRPDPGALRGAVRGGATLGLLAGVVFFGLLLTWISRFGILPWTLLVIAQALFLAAFGALVAAWGSRPGRAVVVVVAWTGLEVLRGEVPLGGFPWGLLGLTQHDGGALLDLARVGGVALVSVALSSVSVAVETVAWTLAGELGAGSMATPRIPRTSIWSGVAALVWLLALIGLPGVMPAAPAATGRTLDVAAVQGNDLELPPTVDRLNRVRIERVVERMAAATQRLADEVPPDLVVWPENALDSDYRQDPTLQRLVQDSLDAVDGTPLLAGTLLDGPSPGTAFNTLLLIGEDGEPVDRYVKRKLVPFGEYVPARSWLDWFPPLEQVPVDYLPGEGPHVLSIDDALVGPVTCYESVFRDLVHDQVREGAEMLVVSTNNASFGRTPASRQHLAFSQLRAVETGRWVVHAGISGISGLVDPQGDLSQRTELFEQAIVRADVPLVDVDTPAIRWSPVVEMTAVAGFLLAVAWVAVRAAVRRRRRQAGMTAVAMVDQPVAASTGE